MNDASKRDAYNAYLKSDEWKAQRQQAFAHWGKYCQCCLTNKALHVHHLNYRNLHDVTPLDLMPLCEPCHDKAHSIKELDVMKHYLGEPHEKRRRVLSMLRAPASAFTTVAEPPTPVTVVLTKGQKRRLAKLKAQAQREAARLHIHAETQKVRTQVIQSRLEKAQYNETCARKTVQYQYNMTDDEIAKYPAATVFAIFEKRCVPLCAKKPQPAPAVGEVTLTLDMINALRTERGAFTSYVVGAFGLNFGTMQAGWIHRLVGTKMPAERYQHLLAFKSVKSKAAKLIAC